MAPPPPVASNATLCCPCCCDHEEDEVVLHTHDLTRVNSAELAAHAPCAAPACPICTSIELHKLPSFNVNPQPVAAAVSVHEDMTIPEVVHHTYATPPPRISLMATPVATPAASALPSPKASLMPTPVASVSALLTTKPSVMMTLFDSAMPTAKTSVMATPVVFASTLPMPKPSLMASLFPSALPSRDTSPRATPVASANAMSSKKPSLVVTRVASALPTPKMSSLMVTRVASALPKTSPRATPVASALLMVVPVASALTTPTISITATPEETPGSSALPTPSASGSEIDYSSSQDEQNRLSVPSNAHRRSQFMSISDLLRSIRSECNNIARNISRRHLGGSGTNADSSRTTTADTSRETCVNPPADNPEIHVQDHSTGKKIQMTPSTHGKPFNPFNPFNLFHDDHSADHVLTDARHSNIDHLRVHSQPTAHGGRLEQSRSHTHHSDHHHSHRKQHSDHAAVHNNLTLPSQSKLDHCKSHNDDHDSQTEKVQLHKRLSHTDHHYRYTGLLNQASPERRYNDSDHHPSGSNQEDDPQSITMGRNPVLPMSHHLDHSQNPLDNRSSHTYLNQSPLGSCLRQLDNQQSPISQTATHSNHPESKVDNNPSNTFNIKSPTSHSGIMLIPLSYNLSHSDHRQSPTDQQQTDQSPSDQHPGPSDHTHSSVDHHHRRLESLIRHTDHHHIPIEKEHSLEDLFEKEEEEDK